MYGQSKNTMTTFNSLMAEEKQDFFFIRVKMYTTGLHNTSFQHRYRNVCMCVSHISEGAMQGSVSHTFKNELAYIRVRNNIHY